MADKKDIASTLMRKGYSVVDTADGGQEISQKTFWGHLSYYTKDGRTTWGFNKRAWLLIILYFLGLVGMLYWACIRKPALENEIRNVVK